jgi:tetratricopeptide (TPR) repeat protein
MSSSAQRAALDAIHQARPLVARLGESKNSEDIAADIIEAWTAVEAGLRSLVGGSALTGQMLIRELRGRHFLSLEQANALAEFYAARERASRTDYRPTDADVNATRDAFLKLEAGLMGAAPPSTRPSGAASAAPAAAPAASRATVPMDSAPIRPEPVSRKIGLGAGRRPSWLLPIVGALALVGVVVLAWWLLATGSNAASYNEGVVAYRENRREAAAGAFTKAAREDPQNPMPLVFLARMAREAGRLGLAQEHAVAAVKVGPGNAAALRELASVSFAQQNYDGARRFYIRALQADPSDQLSQGYLGCSLVRLGRIDEGVKFIQRAGNGPWAGCVPAPGTVPSQAGQHPAAQYPPGYQPAPAPGYPR